MVDFHRHLRDRNDDAERDLGIALAKLARQHEFPPAARMALSRLDLSLVLHPADVGALEARAEDATIRAADEENWMSGGVEFTGIGLAGRCWTS